MEKRAFTMKLIRGREYREHRDAIWPELQHLIKQAGISGYSLFTEAQTNILSGVLKTANRSAISDLPLQPAMHRWRDHMKARMETKTGDSSFTIPRTEVFFSHNIF